MLAGHPPPPTKLLADKMLTECLVHEQDSSPEVASSTVLVHIRSIAMLFHIALPGPNELGYYDLLALLFYR